MKGAGAESAIGEGAGVAKAVLKRLEPAEAMKGSNRRMMAVVWMKAS